MSYLPRQLEDIENHADECSMYLLNEDKEEIYNVINVDCEEVEPSIAAITDLTKSELKQNLIDEITQLANIHLVNEAPRRMSLAIKSVLLCV